MPFFMRRSFAADPLYWACFSEYVQEIVGNGDQPLEFFIEGTRSRTGKALHPKVGLMGAALRPYFEGRVNEINLLPIAVTYEERMETHLYADEMLGTPKPKESFGKVFKARNVMKHNHGRMHVRLGPIISADAFLNPRVSRARHTLSPGPTPFDTQDRAAVVDISYKVIEHQQRSFVVTVPVLLAALSLSWTNGGLDEVTVDQAIRECGVLQRAVRDRGYSVDVVPRGKTPSMKTTEEALLTGLEKWLTPLDPSVEKIGSLLKLKLGKQHAPFNSMLLVHLRNELLHVFVAESLVLASIICCTGANPNESTSSSAAYDQFVFLHKLVFNEVILRFNTNADRRKCFDDALASLVESNLIRTSESEGLGTVGRYVDDNGKPIHDGLGSLILSLVSCYVVACTNALTWCTTYLKSGMDTNQIVSAIRNSTIQQRPEVPVDCLSTDTIKNSLNTFRALQVVERTSKGLIQLGGSEAVSMMNKKLSSICTSLGLDFKWDTQVVASRL